MTRKEIETKIMSYSEKKRGIIVAIPKVPNDYDDFKLLNLIPRLRVKLPSIPTPLCESINGTRFVFGDLNQLLNDSKYMEDFIDLAITLEGTVENICIFY